MATFLAARRALWGGVRVHVGLYGAKGGGRGGS